MITIESFSKVLIELGSKSLASHNNGLLTADFRTQEFIELECEELATIDALREKADRDDSALPTSPFLSNGNDHHELSKSLFSVRHRDPGEVIPPNDPQLPIGRVKRLLKSNSLNALANINFGWRKETPV